MFSELLAALLLSQPSPAAIRPDWALQMTEAPAAWKLSEGSDDIVIAVIDTGLDKTHPDLKDTLWRNPGESGWDEQGRDKSTNGIDDDGNGFIDDISGWNFAGGNNDFSDRHGHGTHVAGIIAGRRFGIAPKVKLMILKYYDPLGNDIDHLKNTVRAIQYAVKMKARIINYSGGGLTASLEEEKAIGEASAKGILFVAAAGNEKNNSDLTPYFPADYKLPNILSVTALNPQSRVLTSSNYGERSVDLAAPGENILSTLPGGTYGVMTGTSQATAFASGAAALLMSQEGDWSSPERVIRHLVRTGDKEETLRGKTKHQARLNVYRALAQKDQTVLSSNVDPSIFFFK